MASRRVSLSVNIPDSASMISRALPPAPRIRSGAMRPVRFPQPAGLAAVRDTCPFPLFCRHLGVKDSQTRQPRKSFPVSLSAKEQAR